MSDPHADIAHPDIAHPDIAHLAPLLGTWRGRGQGSYPTIESFGYLEEITFGHVGKPFIAYTQKTRHAETDLPLHAEAGYLRPVGLDRLELVLVQPSGIVEMHEGVISRDGADDAIETTIALASTTVLTTATAKDATSVTRTLTISGTGADAEINYRLSMAAVGLELQHHLAASLKKVDAQG